MSLSVGNPQRSSLSEHELGLVAVRGAIAGGAEVEVVAVGYFGLEEFDPGGLVDDPEDLVADEGDLTERRTSLLKRHGGVECGILED